MRTISVILDPGHGGIDAKGKYTTAPSKMWEHSKEDVAYEGVINRRVVYLAGCYLAELCQFVYYTVRPEDPTDVSLAKRVNYANDFNKDTSLYISFHSNSSPTHLARGIEIFTSKGETKSDVLATYIGKELMEEFPDMKFRTDYTDGDLDKEANFYVLKNTDAPAVLLEFLFFDNKEDWELLKTESVLKRYAWRVACGIAKFVKTLP